MPVDDLLRLVQQRITAESGVEFAHVRDFIQQVLEGVEFAWSYVDSLLVGGYELEGSVHAAVVSTNGFVYDFVFGKEGYRRIDITDLLVFGRPFLSVSEARAEFRMAGPEYVGTLTFGAEGADMPQLVDAALALVGIWRSRHESRAQRR